MTAQSTIHFLVLALKNLLRVLLFGHLGQLRFLQIHPEKPQTQHASASQSVTGPIGVLGGERDGNYSQGLAVTKSMHAST